LQLTEEVFGQLILHLSIVRENNKTDSYSNALNIKS